MSNESLRDETARLDRAVFQVYRYGMLVFILGLFVMAIQDHLHTALGHDPYRGYIFPSVLLFNHLVWVFKWPRPVTNALYILSSGGMILGLFYLFYLSRVLYPIHMPGAN